jgi:hypothetical protein
MKLGSRILDLVSALAHGQTAGAAPSRRREPGSGAEGKAQQIRRSLATAEGRREKLQEGRDRESLLVRREMAVLSRSVDQLQAALDIVEARLAVVPPLAKPGDYRRIRNCATVRPAQASETREAASATSPAESPAQDQGVSATPPADDLEARKKRLAGPA